MATDCKNNGVRKDRNWESMKGPSNTLKTPAEKLGYPEESSYIYRVNKSNNKNN